MDAISNPAHARRGDRRRTRRQVDEAFARGIITAADRATRMAHVDAATTKGDLAMVVRDLEARRAPTPPSRPGHDHAVPPPPHAAQGPQALQQHGQYTTPQPQGGRPPAAAAPRSSSGARTAVIIAVAFGAMALVVPFVVAMIAVLTASSERPSVATATTDPTAATTAGEQVDLLTQQTFSQLVDALEAEAGGSEVYDLDVYRSTAWARVKGESEVFSRNFLDGEWDGSDYGITIDPDETPTDLSDLAPDFIDRLRESAAAELGAESVDAIEITGVSIGSERPGRVSVRVADTSDTWMPHEAEADLKGNLVG